MAYLHFDNVGIAALTCAVPSFVQKVKDAESSSNPAYIKTFTKQTGIKQRHISITEQTATDLAYAASLKAFEKAGWTKDSIDALVFMSQTPDYNPGTGNGDLLQFRLGLPTDTLAFDITLGCSSFPYGLSVCASLLQQEGIKRVLMVSGDTQWWFLPSKEAVLAEETFIHGEGCTAILLENQENNPIDISLHSDGAGYKFLFRPFDGARNAWRRCLNSGARLSNGEIMYGAGGYMDGLEITMFSTTTVVDSIKAFLERQKKTVEDYDALVLHQANMQIMKTIAKRLKVSMDKVPVSVDRYANTSGASVSITIADAYAGLKKSSISLLTSAFGIGLSWGVASLEIDPSVIEPIFTYDGRYEEGFVKLVE